MPVVRPAGQMKVVEVSQKEEGVVPIQDEPDEVVYFPEEDGTGDPFQVILRPYWEASHLEGRKAGMVEG